MSQISLPFRLLSVSFRSSFERRMRTKPVPTTYFEVRRRGEEGEGEGRGGEGRGGEERRGGEKERRERRGEERRGEEGREGTYFFYQKFIWPNYLQYISVHLSQSAKERHNIYVLDGEESEESIKEKALQYLNLDYGEGKLQSPKIEHELQQEYSDISRLITFYTPTVGVTGCSSLLGSHVLYSLLRLGYLYFILFYFTLFYFILFYCFVSF